MLNYQLDGPPRGETVMLSNSLASDIGMWKYQVHALVEAGYRVLRYDNRGHGKSAAPPGPYSLELLTEDALALMDYLELEKIHFCGLSLGGMVGQMLGAFHGDRLISLALCATGSHISLPDSEWEERIKAARINGMEALAEGTLDRWFTKTGREHLREDVAKIRKSIISTSVEGYSGCVAAIRAMDLREIISGIFVPTVIIVGAKDQGTPVSASEFIHKRISESSLKVIPDAAHFVNMEQSEMFNDCLITFLAEKRTVK